MPTSVSDMNFLFSQCTQTNAFYTIMLKKTLRHEMAPAPEALYKSTIVIGSSGHHHSTRSFCDWILVKVYFPRTQFDVPGISPSGVARAVWWPQGPGRCRRRAWRRPQLPQMLTSPATATTARSDRPSCWIRSVCGSDSAAAPWLENAPQLRLHLHRCRVRVCATHAADLKQAS